MARRLESSGVTGKIVERELFGESQFHKFERSPEIPTHWGRLNFVERLRLLKRLQPFKPESPAPDFAKTVHSLVAHRLGIKPEYLRFFTAIESPVDWHNKIDGWFEVLKAGQYLRVTIDLTKNPEKGIAHDGADIDFLVPHDGLDQQVNREEFLEYSSQLADNVVNLFHQQGLKSVERRAS